LTIIMTYQSKAQAFENLTSASHIGHDVMVLSFTDLDDSGICLAGKPGQT